MCIIKLIFKDAHLGDKSTKNARKQSLHRSQDSSYFEGKKRAVIKMRRMQGFWGDWQSSIS